MSTEYPNPNDEEFFKQEFLETFFTVDRSIREEKKGELLVRINDQPNRIVNLSGDPVLHVVIAYPKSKLACELIDEMQRPRIRLLAMKNKITMDRALHVAASLGDETVAKKLIETDYRLLHQLNEQKETPLHKAAFYGQKRVFKMLENAETSEERKANILARTGDGNTILHCAILGEAPELALYIVIKYPELAETRNREGATPLQLLLASAPAILSAKERLTLLDTIIYKLISVDEKNEDKLVGEDLDPENPNVRNQINKIYVHKSHNGIKVKYSTNLLPKDRLLVFHQGTAYGLHEAHRIHCPQYLLLALPPCGRCAVPYEDETRKSPMPKARIWNESPLTLGIKMGLYDFVEQILMVCPASSTVPDQYGHNILQVAIEQGQGRIVDLIVSLACTDNPVLSSSWLSSVASTDGSNISHFAANATVNEKYASPLQLRREMRWFKRVQRLVPKELRHRRNKKQQTASELFSEKHKAMLDKAQNDLTKMGELCSGLVAAVVFASSFTIPGDKVNGKPMYMERLAFKIFSHAYVIGLSCASTALVLCLSFATSQYREEDFESYIPTKYRFAALSFIMALVALLVAFSCNIYLSIYGGEKVEARQVIPFVCELLVLPTIFLLYLINRQGTALFGITEFLRELF